MRNRATRIRLAAAYGLAACKRAAKAAAERGKGPGLIQAILSDGDVARDAECDERTARGRAIAYAMPPDDRRSAERAYYASAGLAATIDGFYRSLADRRAVTA